MTNIILAGGSGTRLWPLSRTLMPKQFVKIFGEKSLFQLTLERNSKFCDKTLVVSNAEQYFLAKDQLDFMQNVSFLLESVGKNTAPAITLACLSLPLDEIVLVSPSDHLIKDLDSYKEVLQKAKDFAEQGFLVAFGIKPSYAETGFGYIKMRENYEIKSFYEKPNTQKAQEYVEDGSYFWNSGMFCFKVSALLDEIQKHSSEILKACKNAIKEAKKEGDLLRIPFEVMNKIPENSLDYAVMEKSQNTKVIPSNIAWSDVGSFDALVNEFSKDKDANTLLTTCETIESHNNFVFSSDKEKHCVLIGMQDCILIDTKDALLVCKKGMSQRIKEVVKKLGNNEICKTHIITHRPWGSYTILENAEGYKVKKLIVNPGKRLSLQKHFHRNEHWIVVSGTASVEVNGEKRLVRPNESTYIKMGEAHRLGNDGKIPVVLIEAQVGEYTGEDDIIRLEDDFKRN